MAELQINCFGAFKVILAGTSLTAFQTDKTRALLAYLAVNGEMQQRTALAEFLWPGYSRESAQNSFRQTLHQLRQLLGDAETEPPWLLLTRQTLQINPAASIRVDVTTFQRLLTECKAHAHAALATCAPCLERLRQAVDLYQGDFLAELAVVESDTFEEWRRILQEQLHIQMLAALTQLADAAENAGDDEGALQAAQRQLALEPWLEAAHRHVMRILAKRGQRAAALAQYQRCCQVLAEELGVEPDAETTALYEQIQRSSVAKATPQRVVPQATPEQGQPARAPVPAEPSPPAAVPVHHLPHFPTPLIGRAQALAELAAQLQRPEARLLTLVGPGGMGKTRLAVEVGHTQAAAFADGVFFVPLAPISTADALAPAIANALGLTLQGGDPQRVLCQLLSQKQLLLILDNFEHLLAVGTNATDLVVNLLTAAPGVQIIVTSRERLKLRGEQTYAVPALAFSTTATLAEANAAAAIRLFVQSMQRMQGDFQLTAANLAAVLRICQAVQGMPLGLELAAANARGAPLTAIAAALEQSAEVLSVDWRDLPERQRSMRAVFAWSWQLLSAEEQRILRQCAVFRGGFTYAAVQAVTGATLPFLTRLVDKSLLQWQVTATGEGRYNFHELLRQFAAEHLAAVVAEQEVVAARHSEFYLNYLAAREMRLTRAEPRAAAAEIQEELDNIRQAWQRAVQRGNFSALQRSAWTLFSFCRHIGALAEGLHAFQPMADQTSVLTPPALPLRQPHDPTPSRLVAIYAYFLVLQSKLDEAIVVAQQALTLVQAEETADAAALSYFSWGQALRLQGQLADAQPRLEQTLRLAGAAVSTAKSELLYDVECLAGIWLGALAADRGRYQQAREQMERSLRLAQTLGKRRLEMTALINMADIARRMGAYPSARQDYEAGLRLTREVGFRWGEGSSQLELGEVVRLQGEYGSAILLMESALPILQEIGAHDKKAVALTWLGHLYAYLGDSTTAEAWLTRYQQFADEAQGWEPIIEHLQARMVLALHRGELAQALAYATEGWQIGQTHGLPDMQAYALIGIGHAQSQLGVWSAAATAYQQAFDLYTAIQRPDLAAEAQAGLAAIAQQQGDQRQALDRIEAVLAQLAKQPTSGQDEPFFLYLTCYQVLAAAQDPRTPTIVQQGYALLQRYAEQINDDALRRSFLENVPVHRALQQAYTAAQSPRTIALPVKEAEQHDQVKEVVQPVIVQTAAPLPAPSVPLSQLLDWDEMPAVDFFTGRTTEMAQLVAWLTPQKLQEGNPPLPQLISVLGMGGIGKTTLAAAVTKAVAPNFAVVIWRSLLNAPPVDELLCNWLQILSRQTLTALPASFDEQLRQLLTYLRQERCLLVLDNLESLFAVDDAPGRAGMMRSGYEGYDQLLQRLASSDHQSCLLLTSREQPYALLRLGRQTQETSGRSRVLALTGLDRQAGNVLLQSNGLHTSAEAAAQLIDQYSGNPLALQIVAATIADFFGGDVVAFQQEEGAFFDGMRLVLDQQFARLSPLERDLIVWLAIEREPIPVQTLRSNFVQPVATRELLEALQSLQNRFLLEKHDAGLTLQNVIIEYTTNYLIEQVGQEILGDKETGSVSPLLTPRLPVSLSFLNRFALLKAQAKEYVRQSQARLIVQPLIARLLVRLSKAELVSALQRIITQLQAEPMHGAGYAAGNVLNLLVQLGVDLQGSDFSRLTIRQAYLQGTMLDAVSLAQADLQQCVFTTAFGAVLSLALSPDDQLLAAATNDWMVRVWRLSDGQLYQSYEGHTNVVRSVAFSPDGRWLASASLDQTVRLWDVVTGQLLCVLKGHTSGVYSAVFCQGGSVLASAGRDGVVRLWDVNTGQPLAVLHGHTDRISRLAVDLSGVRLASGGTDQTVRLWDLTTGQCIAVFQEHKQGVSCLAFSPNGAMLASGGAGQQIRLWDVATGQTRHILRGHEHWLRAVAFSPDGALLASASADHTVRLWDTASGQPRGLLQGHTNAVWALAFTADGNRLVSGGVDHQLRVWDVRNPADSRAINVVQAHSGSVLAVAVSPDGQLLATGDQHRLVRLWAVDSGQQLGVLSGHTDAVRSVGFSPDGRTLVSTSDDGAVQLWDVAQRRLLKTLGRHPNHVCRVAYHPRGDFVASCGHKDAVRVWDLRPQGGGRLLHSLAPSSTGRTPSAFGVAFSPDGCHLASAHGGDSLYVWDVASGQCLYTLASQGKELEWVAWSPNGATLAGADMQGAIHLWDMQTRSPSPIAHTLEVGAYLWDCAFSPDSRLLVSAAEDPVIRLWDVESGVCVQTLSGHTQNASGAVFLPDNKTLVSSSYDSTLRFWNVQTGELLKTLPVPGPYTGLNITGVTGISEAQKAALRTLGAVER